MRRGKRLQYDHVDRDFGRLLLIEIIKDFVNDKPEPELASERKYGETF